MLLATTSQLSGLLRDAARQEFNRAFTTQEVERFVDKLDPKGVHVVSIILLHEHKNGLKVPAHYRVWLLADRKSVV